MSSALKAWEEQHSALISAEREWYSTDEVAILLNKSKSSIYQYAKKGKLVKIKDPHRLYRTARFEKEGVLDLARSFHDVPEGVTPQEAASRTGKSLTAIYNFISEGELLAYDISVNAERKSYIIDESSLNKLIERLSGRGRHDIPNRSEYYDSKLDIALYQLFESPSYQQLRLIKNEYNEWQFLVPTSAQTIPYQQGLEYYLFKPAYSLHKESLPSAKGYARFYLEKRALYNVLPLLDTLYEMAGIENVKVRDHQKGLMIFVKAGEYNSIKDEAFGLLQQHLIEGFADQIDRQLVIRSAYRKTLIDLKDSEYEYALAEAQSRHLSLSQWIEQLIEETRGKKREEERNRTNHLQYVSQPNQEL